MLTRKAQNPRPVRDMMHSRCDRRYLWCSSITHLHDVSKQVVPPIGLHALYVLPEAIILVLLLDSLDGDCALGLELLAVALFLFLLAVLEAGAIVRLEHAVLAAEVAAAEAAVTNDALCGVLAIFEVAADLLGCAAAEGQSDVEGALPADGVGGEGF